MTKILYFGAGHAGTTSRHRCDAITRIGHQVELRDPVAVVLPQLESWRGAINFKTGYSLLQGTFEKWLENVYQTMPFKPDFIWIDLGEFFGPACMKILQRWKVPIVIYNVDDPTGKRDGHRFKQFIRAIPYTDLIVVVRQESVDECRALGAARVEHVFRSYDEVMHRPFDSVSEISDAFRSEVAFIGTWMRHEKRDEFMLALIERGVPVSIWGDRWQKSPLFPKLKKNWRGGALYDRDYVAAIQGSKLCIGMLSKGNRDLHTTRSLEIPFAGGVFCGERTIEHKMLYEEGKEAIFWSNVEECAEACHRLLKDDTFRENVRKAGMAKVRSLQLGNEDIARRIVGMVMGSQ